MPYREWVHPSPCRYPWSWTVPALLVIMATAATGALRYPRLPDRLVLHYNPLGGPGAVATRSVPAAFGPVFLQLVLTGAVLLLALVAVLAARRDPGLGFRAGLASRALLFLAAFGDLSLFFVARQLWWPDAAATTGILAAVLVAALGIAGVIGLFAH